MQSTSTQQAALWLLFLTLSSTIFISVDRAQQQQHMQEYHNASPERSLLIACNSTPPVSRGPSRLLTYIQLVEMESIAAKTHHPRVQAKTHARLALSMSNVPSFNAQLGPELATQLAPYSNIILADVPREANKDVSYDNIRVLLRSFQLLLDKDTALVLCVGGRSHPLDLPIHVVENVVQFLYEPWQPENPKARLGPAAKAVERLMVYQAAVVLSGFKGNVMVVDTVDTVLQATPFPFYQKRLSAEGIAFFAEQVTVRQDPAGVAYSLRRCARSVLGAEQGDAISDHVGFMPTLSPVYMGPASRMLDLWRVLAQALVDHPCGEQGMLHLLVLSGAARDQGLVFFVEPAMRGSVLSCRDATGSSVQACGLYRITGKNSVKSLMAGPEPVDPVAVLHGWTLRSDLRDAVLLRKTSSSSSSTTTGGLEGLIQAASRGSDVTYVGY